MGTTCIQVLFRRNSIYFNTWNPAGPAGGKFEGAVGIDVDPDTRRIYLAEYPRGLVILEED